jgi:ribosome modulation factor
MEMAMTKKPSVKPKKAPGPSSRISSAETRGYEDFAARAFKNPYRDRAMRRAWASGFREAAQEHRDHVRSQHRRADAPADQAVA